MGKIAFFGLALSCILGLIAKGFFSEIEDRDYDEVTRWAESSSPTVQKMLIDAAENKKITEWEYYWIEIQRNDDVLNQAHTAARQKALDAISKPK